MLRASGKTYEFLGFRRAYVEDVDDEEGRRGRVAAAAGRRRRAGRARRAAAGAPRDEAAGALHRGEPREGARREGDRPAVDLRVGDADDPGARVRVAQGQRAGSGVDGVRGRPAARAALRPPRRLRLHRDDGRGPRRHRARRGRSREVAPHLLLRERPGRSARAGRRREPRPHRPARDQHDPDRHRRRRNAGRGARRPVRALRAGRRGRRRGSIPPDLAPDELTVDVALELARRQAEGSAGARRRSRDRPARVRAQRPLRPVRAARRDERRRRQEGREAARASLFKTMQPETVTLEQALDAAVAAACRRRR